MSGPADLRPAGSTPVRVAVVNDYEVVVAGVAALLEPWSDRVQVVELASGTAVLSDVDVLLYDAYTRERVVPPVTDVVSTAQAKVVIYTWALSPEIVTEALEAGVAGCLSKTVAAGELVDAIEKVHAGSVVVHPDPGPEPTTIGGDWPGRDAGLSQRESEIIALIAQGLSNAEVASRAYLSINSVKTHIRSAYRKMGVASRTQAVLWATEHGFRQDVSRRVLTP